MARKCIDATEYMYCSSRLRALESKLVGGKGLDALIECSSYDEALLKLSDLGISLVKDENGAVLLEETLVKVLDVAYAEVTENCPNPQQLDFLRYAYDCNNLKAVLKCNVRGISPDSMLYVFGTIPIEKVKKAAVEEISECPEHMRSAIGEAIEAYAKTKNPQHIDMILDRACFADMLKCADLSGCELSKDLVNTRITLVNIMMCIRLLRMNMEQAGEKMLMTSLLDGGEFDRTYFSAAYEGGIDKLCEMLEYTNYRKLVSDGGKSVSATELERRADDIYLSVAKRAKLIPFGIEVALGYLVACEYDVKNIRIVLSAKRAGEDRERTRERLRGSYV